MEGLALNLLPDDLDVSSGQTSPSASSLQDSQALHTLVQSQQ